MSKPVPIIGYRINSDEKTRVQILLYENYIEINDDQDSSSIKLFKTDLQINFLGSGGGIAIIQKDELKFEIYDIKNLKQWLNPNKMNFEINWGIGNLLFLMSQLTIVFGLLFWLWKTEKWVDFVIQIIPQEIEAKLGHKIQSELKNQFAFENCQDNLKNTLSNLLSPSDLKNVQFSILNQEEPNAFATPGHLMYFNLGLFRTATAEEFIAITAHEYGHITYRHSLRTLIKHLGTHLIFNLFSQDFNSILLLNSDQFSELIRLNYSRDLEMEADLFAQERLKKSQLPNYGLISFFNKLKANEFAPLQNLSFLSSHPSHKERIQYLQQHSEKSQIQNLKLNSDYVELISCLNIKTK